MLEKIKEFATSGLSEDNGNPSAMRQLVALIIVVFLANYTFANIHSVLAGSGIISFGWEEIAALVGPLAAKAHQKGKEKQIGN